MKTNSYIFNFTKKTSHFTSDYVPCISSLTLAMTQMSEMYEKEKKINSYILFCSSVAFYESLHTGEILYEMS